MSKVALAVDLIEDRFELGHELRVVVLHLLKVAKLLLKERKQVLKQDHFKR